MLNPFLNDDASVINKAIDMNSSYKVSCSVAKVTAINKNPISVDVQPLVKYCDIFSEERWLDYPELTQVPLAQLFGSKFSVKLPINVGDTGIVLWCDREVFSALSQTTPLTTEPASGELSDLQACVFIPAMPLFALAPQIKQKGLEFVSDNVELVGELLVLVQNVLDTLAALQTFSSELITAGAPYASSPSAPVTGSYAIEVAKAATNMNNSIANVTSSCNDVLSKLTKFKGDQ